MGYHVLLTHSFNNQHCKVLPLFHAYVLKSILSYNIHNDVKKINTVFFLCVGATVNLPDYINSLSAIICTVLE